MRFWRVVSPCSPPSRSWRSSSGRPNVYSVIVDAAEDAGAKTPGAYGTDELTFSREIGLYLALAAATGLAIASVFALLGGRSARA